MASETIIKFTKIIHSKEIRSNRDTELHLVQTIIKAHHEDKLFRNLMNLLTEIIQTIIHTDHLAVPVVSIPGPAPDLPAVHHHVVVDLEDNNFSK